MTLTSVIIPKLLHYTAASFPERDKMLAIPIRYIFTFINHMVRFTLQQYVSTNCVVITRPEATMTTGTTAVTIITENSEVTLSRHISRSPTSRARVCDKRVKLI